jgi:putative integrase
VYLFCVAKESKDLLQYLLRLWGKREEKSEKNNGANIKTVASLLGHSGLKHTGKYTRAVDKLKSEAINSLPELKL